MVSTTLQSELEAAVRVIQRVVRSVVPGAVSGHEASSMVALLSEAERATSSGIARLAPVVNKTGDFAKLGHGSAADWLGAALGTSTGVAKGRLVAAERAAATPEVAEAVREGELSSAQLNLVTDATAVAPGAARTMLALVAEQASHQELSDALGRLRAAERSRESEQARRKRVQAMRHLRWRRDETGGIRGEFLCDEVAWARVSPRLEAEAQRRWKAAGAGAGASDDSLDALRLDALLDLLAGSSSRGPGARAHTLVLIDAEALRRGTAQADELCEIEGIGPVSVDAATELIGEGGMQFLVRDGVDIRTVTSTTRALAQRIQMALLSRDRVCVVPGCGKHLGLEADHWQIDFGRGGETSLANLARLCPQHHDLKTYGGWRLEGGPGSWAWVPPKRPPSAGFIKRARKLAAARAIRD